jgi:hypothetical protein
MLSTRRNVCATERFRKTNVKVVISPLDLDLIDETCDMMRDALLRATCRQELQSEEYLIVLENVHMYLNKIKMYHESINSSGSATTRPVEKSTEPINEAHLKLKRALRMYEDSLDEFELRGSQDRSPTHCTRAITSLSELSLPKTEAISQPSSNFKKKKEHPTSPTADDLDLLELEVCLS